MPLPLQAKESAEVVQPSAAVAESWKLLGEIEAAIRAGDLGTLRSTSETLKGTITSVLAQQAFEAATILENAQDEEDLARAHDAFRRLREAIQCLQRGITAKPDE
jgi:hypothetical protein